MPIVPNPDDKAIDRDPSPPKIVLFMEGGIIHAAYASDPETVVEIVDHDLLQNGSSARPWSDNDRAGLHEVPTAIINEVEVEE